ncbi:MAG: acyl-CoA dehydratase activase [Chloroflexota bacterium]|nr:acyl-CoA dehydratase activase [Chloroflexota bacterium]
MVVAGVDVGAATAKAVVINDGHVLGHAVVPTGYDVTVAAEKATLKAIEAAGLSCPIGKLEHVVSTGYARNTVTFANKSITEILCHAKGAHFWIPEARTVIDIGGQDSKAIELDEEGNVKDFVMNDKCAAGTGRFLDVMSLVLEVGSIDNMGSLSLESRNPCVVTSTCTIFAESEIVSLRAQGKKREDLIAGVHDAIARRVSAMAKKLSIKPKIVFTGGVAKNAGVKKALETALANGMAIEVPEEPQIIGALGAALLANEAIERLE